MADGEFLNAHEEDRLVQRISLLEKHTSAEVRIHVAKKTSRHGIVYDALKIFHKLGMKETKNHNGVLIYVSVSGREVTCLGDKNAHAKIQDMGWNHLIELITQHFKKGDFYLGLFKALETLEDWLSKHFPPEETNPDELPNTISKDK